ncbi:CNPV288 C-type lectin-like protein [Canarypox virus]|uniref:CNPV288 C-type lectin-like protein n=1 Tax=Canarypox virus TaxID=44088 RepID=Q6VZ59_CNPV|nr:CNPV288 C-type lectin-like protein [Canarypox virus]AAR83634.1 CNPV288 C-type lectin-like protein [Canarypox virus]AWD84764.1 C-type lectin-like protein [Canarypox virus]
MDTDHFNLNKLINCLSYFICIVSVFVIITTVISIIPQKKECGIEWIEHNGLCYKLYLDLKWKDAIDQCHKEHSSLVQVTDKDVEFFNKFGIGCIWMRNRVTSNSTYTIESGGVEMSITFPVVTCACYENSKVVLSDCDQEKPYICYK